MLAVVARTHYMYIVALEGVAARLGLKGSRAGGADGRIRVGATPGGLCFHASGVRTSCISSSFGFVSLFFLLLE